MLTLNLLFRWFCTSCNGTWAVEHDAKRHLSLAKKCQRNFGKIQARTLNKPPTARAVMGVQSSCKGAHK